MKQAQKQLCIDPKGTINGFNYAFVQANLQALKELYCSEEVYEDPEFERLSSKGEVVIRHIGEQVLLEFSGVCAGHAVKRDVIYKLIKHTEWYLAIFEKK